MDVFLKPWLTRSVNPASLLKWQLCVHQRKLLLLVPPVPLPLSFHADCAHLHLSLILSYLPLDEVFKISTLPVNDFWSGKAIALLPIFYKYNLTYTWAILFTSFRLFQVLWLILYFWFYNARLIFMPSTRFNESNGSLSFCFSFPCSYVYIA